MVLWSTSCQAAHLLCQTLPRSPNLNVSSEQPAALQSTAGPLVVQERLICVALRTLYLLYFCSVPALFLLCLLLLDIMYCCKCTDHSNRVNKAIHLLCIWPILWTGLALMSRYSLGKLPPGVLEQLPLRDEAWGLHPGTIVSLVYIALYLGEI